MIEWKLNQTIGDPAGDLSNVTLTLPTPPPGAMLQHQQQLQQPHDTLFQPSPQASGSMYTTQRPIRPFPARSRIASSAPRSVSVTMAEPSSAMNGQYPTSALSIPYGAHQYSQRSSPAPPMYGEDQVPMTVQMPIGASGSGSNLHLGPPPLSSVSMVPLSSSGMVDPRSGTPILQQMQASSPPLLDVGSSGAEVLRTSSSGLTWESGEGGASASGTKRERSQSEESDASE